MAEIALEDAPRKARDLFDKGFAAMERGNLDYAIDMFLATLDLEPQLLQVRKFLRAAEIKKFKNGKNSPLGHQLSTMKGMSGMVKARAVLKKDPFEALRVAEKLLKIDPLNMQFIYLLDDTAVACDLPEVAVQTLVIAREHYPKDKKLLERLGKLLLEFGSTNKAREAFEALAALRPNDPDVMKMLKDATAIDSMQSGGWTEADSYREVIKDTKEAELIEQESKSVKSGSGLDDLITNTRDKIQAEPENVNYRRSLADLLTRNEEFDEAFAVLQKASSMAGHADSQIDKALTTLKTTQFNAQIKALQKAGNEAGAQVKEKEKSDFLLANAKDRAHRYPNDLQIKYELGELLFQHGELNEAIQQFQASQRNPQRRIRSLYYLALCFKNKGQFDIAAQQLEAASNELHGMDDTKKDILYELGSICESMSNMEKAVSYYKEIYSVDIGYKDVAKKIEQAYQT